MCSTNMTSSALDYTRVIQGTYRLFSFRYQVYKMVEKLTKNVFYSYINGYCYNVHKCIHLHLNI